LGMAARRASVAGSTFTPVLFADRAGGVIGAAHAGWKGALGTDGRGQ